MRQAYIDLDLVLEQGFDALELTITPEGPRRRELEARMAAREPALAEMRDRQRYTIDGGAIETFRLPAEPNHSPEHSPT